MALSSDNNDHLILVFLQRTKDAQNKKPLVQNEVLLIPNQDSIVIALNDFVHRNPSLVPELISFMEFSTKYSHKTKILYGIKIELVFHDNITQFKLRLKQSCSKKCLYESRLSLDNLKIFIETFQQKIKLDLISSLMYLRQDSQQYIDYLLTKYTKQQVVETAIDHIPDNFDNHFELFALSIYSQLMIEEYKTMKDESPMLKKLRQLLAEAVASDYNEASDFTKSIKDESTRNFFQNVIFV